MPRRRPGGAQPGLDPVRPRRPPSPVRAGTCSTCSSRSRGRPAASRASRARRAGRVRHRCAPQLLRPSRRGTAEPAVAVPGGHVDGDPPTERSVARRARRKGDPWTSSAPARRAAASSSRSAARSTSTPRPELRDQLNGLVGERAPPPRRRHAGGRVPRLHRALGSSSAGSSGSASPTGRSRLRLLAGAGPEGLPDHRPDQGLPDPRHGRARPSPTPGPTVRTVASALDPPVRRARPHRAAGRRRGGPPGRARRGARRRGAARRSARRSPAPCCAGTAEIDTHVDVVVRDDGGSASWSRCTTTLRRAVRDDDDGIALGRRGGRARGATHGEVAHLAWPTGPSA